MNKFLIDQEFFDKKLKEWNNIYLDELILLNIDTNSISSNIKRLDIIFKELANWKYDSSSACYSENNYTNKLQFMRQLKEIVYIDSVDGKISNTKVHDFLAGYKKEDRKDNSSRIQKLLNKWQHLPVQNEVKGSMRLCSRIFENERNRIYLKGIEIEETSKRYYFKIISENNENEHKLFITNPYASFSEMPKNENIDINHPSEEDKSYYREGAEKRVTVNKYERNSNARKKCIEHYGFKCFICGFDFKKVYGEIGENFIHVHHKIPFNKLKKEYGNIEEYEINPEKDLIPICPNCHEMIHKLRTIGDEAVEELKNILTRNAHD